MRSILLIASLVLLTTLPFNVVASDDDASDYSPSDMSEKITTWSGTTTFRSSVYIPAGEAVIIEPGTIIHLGMGVNITCDGTIRARGTEEHRIEFKPIDPAEGWKGILFRNAGDDRAVSFDNVTIEGGDINFGIINRSAYINNSILRDGVQPQLAGLSGGSYILKNLTVDGGAGAGIGINDCKIRAHSLKLINNSYTGLYAVNSHCYINGLEASGNILSALKLDSSISWISNSSLINSVGCGIDSRGSKVYLNDSVVSGSMKFGISASSSHLYISNSSITDSRYSGIVAQGSELDMQELNLSSNAEFGLELYHVDILSDPMFPFGYRTIRSETFGDSLPVLTSSDAVASDCRILENGYGAVYCIGSRFSGTNLRISGGSYGLFLDGWSSIYLNDTWVNTTNSLYMYGSNGSFSECHFAGLFTMKSSTIMVVSSRFMYSTLLEGDKATITDSSVTRFYGGPDAVILIWNSTISGRNMGRLVMHNCSGHIINTGSALSEDSEVTIDTLPQHESHGPTGAYTYTATAIVTALVLILLIFARRIS